MHLSLPCPRTSPRPPLTLSSLPLHLAAKGCPCRRLVGVGVTEGGMVGEGTGFQGSDSSSIRGTQVQDPRKSTGTVLVASTMRGRCPETTGSR